MLISSSPSSTHIIISSFIHAVLCISDVAPLTEGYSLLEIHNASLHLVVDVPVGGFWGLPIMNKAAVSNHLQVSA